MIINMIILVDLLAIILASVEYSLILEESLDF
jgi:hypothetical protein